jgi:hypothetical protein
MIATGTAGCGCGQRGGSGSSCGCGRAAATGVVYDGAFSRPRFFEGQLLTSDDLQALGDYGRGKDRLHNRYLVGSGVVCGLEVVCSCAHPGSVVVRAGYALDCCGNDIVVACDQLVDINELVRALPTDAACADPCPPPTKSGNGTKQDEGGNGEGGSGEGGSGEDGNGKDGNGKDGNGKDGNGKDGQRAPRRYELVVEYVETPAELVAPYSTGDETSKACEPTRVREGYRFSLRCLTDKPARPPQLVDALACCADAEKWLVKLEGATDTARRLAGGGTAALRAAPSRDELDRAVGRLRASHDLPAAKDLAALGVRFAQAEDAALAKEALGVVSDESGPVSESVQGDPIAAAEAADLGEQVTSLIGRADHLEPTGADLKLAEGIVSGQRVTGAVRSVVEEARDWALCWLEQHPGTHCRAHEDLAGRPVPNADNSVAVQRETELVTATVRQILIDCLCAAVNPPCAPCDDGAVVLAKVTVECCEVVEICNLARRHAVTGSALRYWLPLEWLYCELEKACCGEPDNVTGLTQARDVVRSLATITDCGWPKRWVAPRSDRRAVEAPPVAEPAVAKPDRKGEDEVEALRTRVAELEQRWESLQPPPAPAAATRAAAGRATTTTRPRTTGRPTPTTRPTTGRSTAPGRPATGRATTTSRTSATTTSAPVPTKATDAPKNAKNAKAPPAGKGTSTRKAKGKANASSGNTNG